MTSKKQQPILDVSVVLVSWNTRELVLDCLRSLPAACTGLTWEAIVVDNASSDGTAAALKRELPNVRLIENNDNPGFAAANNQAMRASNARYALLLNSDTVAHANSIAHLVAFADARPQAGIVGPRLLNRDGSFQSSCADLPTAWIEMLSVSSIGERLLRRGYPGFAEHACRQPMTSGYVSGACMLVRREALASVGLMTEDYFMYGEEVDLCWRMWRAGWETWHDPEARIVHYGGQSTKQVKASMLRALFRSKVEVLQRFRGSLHAWLLRLAVFAVWRTKWAVSAIRAVLKKQPVESPVIGWRDLDTHTN
jgi:N-acetylglucosaminyl-diphospho-decaprenol L-rhamnosyltransferase